jgi:hypothetical protein
VTVKLPRFVRAKPLAGGKTAYYWELPSYYEAQGAPFESVALGTEFAAAEAAAKAWNERFNEWRGDVKAGGSDRTALKTGTVKWLVHTYLHSDRFKERVSPRSAPDYENLLDWVVQLSTKNPARPTVGDLLVRGIDPATVDKLYARFCEGGRLRRAEKAVMYCKTAWRVVRRLFPGEFPTDVPNPWEGVTLKKRKRLIKAAVDRDMVYKFAWGAVEHGRPELGAAAVLCYEWLQRPESVIGGGVAWGDYRGSLGRDKIRIEHHKTGELVLHPLDDHDGRPFYTDAEKVLAALPRRGTVMILGPEGQIYKPNRFAQLVRGMADELGLPKRFTLDACRHGGMTDLEEAELTEGQGMALSGHKTPRAYRGYAKLTEERLLAATRRRVAHRRTPDKNSA